MGPPSTPPPWHGRAGSNQRSSPHLVFLKAAGVHLKFKVTIKVKAKATAKVKVAACAKRGRL